MEKLKLKYKVKRIDGWPDYYVSESGDVYSSKQAERAFLNGGMYKLSPKIRKSNGYMEVNLYKMDDNGKYINRSKKVHQLVLEAFKTKPKTKSDQILQCNHIDGNKLNNNINNLEWVTPSANIVHSYRHLNRVKRIRPVLYDGVQWDSIVECCRALGLNQKSMNCILSNGKTTYMGKPISYAGEIRFRKTEPLKQK